MVRAALGMLEAPFAGARVERAASVRDDRRAAVILLPWTAPGGAERVMLEVGTALGGAGIAVHFVSTERGTHSWEPRFRSVTPHVVHLRRLARFAPLPGLIERYVRRSGADIVIVSNSRDAYLAVPALRRTSPEALVVDVLHGEGGRHERGGFPALASRYRDQIPRHVAVSRHLAARLVDRYGFDPDRIEVIPNGGDVPPSADRVRRRASGADTFLVAWIGRLAAEKRPEMVFDIAADIDGSAATFVVAGDGPLRARCERRASRHRGAPVRLAGHLDDAGELLAAADLLLITSEMEGMPLVLLDALRAGMPVVAPRVGGIPEVVDNGVEGILIDDGPFVVTGLADAIRDLIGDSGLRDRMSRSARERGETLSWERAHASYLKTILGAGASPR